MKYAKKKEIERTQKLEQIAPIPAETVYMEHESSPLTLEDSVQLKVCPIRPKLSPLFIFIALQRDFRALDNNFK